MMDARIGRPDGRGARARAALARLRDGLGAAWHDPAGRLRALAVGGAVLAGSHLLAGQFLYGPRLDGLRDEMRTVAAQARDAQSEAARLAAELEDVREVHKWSEEYRIPVDLATAIHEAARQEGLRAELAFRLVQVESGFRQRAVSPVGAVGYTQLLPSTAVGLEPGLDPARLFDRDTNLRLGFRYLVQLLEGYEGDERLALLAYNRGPGVVRAMLSRGEDPANGFAGQVLRVAD
ncbi:MAG: transglycosylase SLT domain-containing protein [Gemmatimonadota bacterium]|nr:transglycosylase SLT domain-containing protein [Gemmatimonadota bacterium]